MFTSFFLELRAAKVPASLREFLTLLEGMRAGVARFDIDEFYFLARAALVKDERHLDRFDRVFGQCFKGIETPSDPQTELPEEWLKQLGERYGTEANWNKIDRLDGFARGRGHNLLELAMSWLAANPCVSSVIAGATKPEQVADNAKAADWKLSAEELTEIDKLLKQ